MEPTEVLLPRQCVAARKLIGIGQNNLAALAKCGLSTLADFERGARSTDYFVKCRLKYALECLGAEFLDYEDGSYGVRSKTTGVGVMLTPQSNGVAYDHA